jgi:hypothetical protein
VRDTTFNGGGGEHFFPPVLKVPRQCPLVLLVEVCLRESKAFGMLDGPHYSKILMLTLGGLHVKRAVQRGIWVNRLVPITVTKSVHCEVRIKKLNCI